MPGYVIRWGDEWTFETVPAHRVSDVQGETIYRSKEAALNAAINQLIVDREVLSRAIARAQKRQRASDARFARSNEGKRFTPLPRPVDR